jgi:hypothetical protein
MARTAWTVVRHLRPERVVETGVARGVTTAVLLQAMERNGYGALWSIDLPDLRLSHGVAAYRPPYRPTYAPDGPTFVARAGDFFPPYLPNWRRSSSFSTTGYTPTGTCCSSSEPPGGISPRVA